MISNTYRSQSLYINEKKDKLTRTSYIYKAALANGYIRNVTLVKKTIPIATPDHETTDEFITLTMLQSA